MASVVVWKIPENQWMADNKEGEQHLFDSESAAIQSACDMESNKDNPDCVLVYKKNGCGMKDKLTVSKK